MQNIQTIIGPTVFADGVSMARIAFDIDSGFIISVDRNNIIPAKSDNYIYSGDCLIFPGMGDIHIHAREDASQKNIYKEDFFSCCEAAINGGVAHVADMPNNPIPPIDDVSYKNKLALTLKHKLPILLYAGIGPNTNPLSVRVPYKAFIGPSIGDLFFKNNDELDLAINRYRGLDVSFHCEDPIILENHKSDADHFKRRPIEAETLATDFALHLIEKYQLKGKLCHYSSGKGLDAIIKAKNKGINVVTEVTPQHLFFSEEKIMNERPQDAVLFQMNPPIRKESDRERMLNALVEGQIDFLATDHAPHSKEEKLKGTSGMPGLDTYGTFVTWLLNENKIAPEKVLKFTASNPGDFFNTFLPTLKQLFPEFNKYGEGLGYIRPNYNASFTVLNLKKGKVFTQNDLKTKAHWSPFLNYQFSGSVEALFISGRKL